MKTENKNRVQINPRDIRQNMAKRMVSQGQMITGDTVASSSEAIYQVEDDSTDTSSED